MSIISRQCQLEIVGKGRFGAGFTLSDCPCLFSLSFCYKTSLPTVPYHVQKCLYHKHRSTFHLNFFRPCLCILIICFFSRNGIWNSEKKLKDKMRMTSCGKNSQSTPTPSTNGWQKQGTESDFTHYLLVSLISLSRKEIYLFKVFLEQRFLKLFCTDGNHPVIKVLKTWFLNPHSFGVLCYISYWHEKVRLGSEFPSNFIQTLLKFYSLILSDHSSKLLSSKWACGDSRKGRVESIF